MYNVKSNKAEEFIDDQEILETIAYAKENKDNPGNQDIWGFRHAAR